MGGGNGILEIGPKLVNILVQGGGLYCPEGDTLGVAVVVVMGLLLFSSEVRPPSAFVDNFSSLSSHLWEELVLEVCVFVLFFWLFKLDLRETEGCKK